MTRVGSGFRMAVPHLTVSVDERTRLAKARLGELVFGKWRLERVIGIGGMAAVFEASHKNGSRVAVKILHSDLASSEEIRERFLTEGYAANRVSHPGVVTVRDEGTTLDGAVFLVMDLLSGQTLAERLEDGREPFSVVEVLEIASQLLDVLVHAHDRGIIHRDIKPENVFLTREGRVRLLDFGIARIASGTHRRKTQLGSALGTPAFMPPEQALGPGEDLDGRSDLWSLAATMFLLLSGTPVREQGSDLEQLLRAMTRPVQSLGDVASLPRSVVAVVDRALAFDREDRFPDARSMQLAVRAVQDELGTPDSRATLSPLSLEPVAVSVRTSRADGGHQRPSSPTMRPVAAAEVSPRSSPPRESRGALPFFISLGFAVGIGIVVAARVTVHSSVHSATPQAPGDVPLAESGPPLPSAPAPAASSLTPPVPPSASARLAPAPSVARPASVPRRGPSGGN